MKPSTKNTQHNFYPGNPSVGSTSKEGIYYWLQRKNYNNKIHRNLAAKNLDFRVSEKQQSLFKMYARLLKY
jgi:hypothetical protein